MKKILFFLSIALLFTSCWPSSVSFKDSGSMPIEWQQFYVKTLSNSAPNAPLNYGTRISEDVKDAVQNNTRLKLTSEIKDAQITIEGAVSGYYVSPIALQQGDVAAKNRLTITVNFNIFISAPKEDKMTLTCARFADYNSSSDLASVEASLIEEINKQITQDVVNKLLSNW